MKRTKILALSLVLAAWITPALADCTANGKRYTTGTILGNYQCQGNGQWTRVRGR